MDEAFVSQGRCPTTFADNVAATTTEELSCCTFIFNALLQSHLIGDQNPQGGMEPNVVSPVAHQYTVVKVVLPEEHILVLSEIMSRKGQSGELTYMCVCVCVMFIDIYHHRTGNTIIIYDGIVLNICLKTTVNIVINQS